MRLSLPVHAVVAALCVFIIANCVVCILCAHGLVAQYIWALAFSMRRCSCHFCVCLALFIITASDTLNKYRHLFQLRIPKGK